MSKLLPTLEFLREGRNVQRLHHPIVDNDIGEIERITMININVKFGTKETSIEVQETFSITGVVLRARRGELSTIPVQGWTASYDGKTLSPDDKVKDIGIKNGGTISISTNTKK